MYRIRPHLGLTLDLLLGGTVSAGSVLAWRHVLDSYRIPVWALGLVAGVTALLVLRGLAEIQHRRSRPKARRAHARPNPAKTRKAA